MSKNIYNAKGSPVMDAAEKTTSDGFKRGGKLRKRGGSVGGAAPAARMDRRARGGSVYSAGKSLDAPGGKSSAGHEGE